MLKNFRTYQLAVQLHQGCEKVQAKHYLKDQLLRASLSIVLNLSEGSAKPSAKDRRKFYDTAFGSCREVQSLLMILNQTSLQEMADKLGGGLYRLTRNTQ